MSTTTDSGRNAVCVNMCHVPCAIAHIHTTHTSTLSESRLYSFRRIPGRYGHPQCTLSGIVNMTHGHTDTHTHTYEENTTHMITIIYSPISQAHASTTCDDELKNTGCFILFIPCLLLTFVCVAVAALLMQRNCPH